MLNSVVFNGNIQTFNSWISEDNKVREENPIVYVHGKIHAQVYGSFTKNIKKEDVPVLPAENTVSIISNPNEEFGIDDPQYEQHCDTAALQVDSDLVSVDVCLDRTNPELVIHIFGDIEYLNYPMVYVVV